jgi:hypothetical protein
MVAAACEGCPFHTSCPIHQTRDGRYELDFTDKDHRMAGRRREQETPVFAERYRLFLRSISASCAHVVQWCKSNSAFTLAVKGFS